MKICGFMMFSALVAAEGSSFAEETKLEIPLAGYYFIDHKEFAVDVAKHNKELNKKGLAGLPETVVVGGNTRSYWNVLKTRIAAANTALGREMHFNLYDDGYGEGYLYKLTMCYEDPSLEYRY